MTYFRSSEFIHYTLGHARSNHLAGLPITFLFALVLLAPLYGGGALLIRELARGAGRGWPTILLLALAYALLEEGITTMSLLNRRQSCSVPSPRPGTPTRSTNP
jgi:hypothetical protein